MYFRKDDIIGGVYTVLFAHKESRNVESYRVKDKEGKTVFLQIFMNSQSSSVYQRYTGKPGFPVYLDEGLVETSDGRRTFVVLKYVSSQTLADYVHQNRIVKPKQALSIIKDLLTIVSTISISDECHTCISNDNVLIPFIDDDTKVMVTGLSNIFPFDKLPDCTPVPTDATIIQAPEYFHGTFSEKSEVYAIGALLYEMCFGMQPWDLDLSIFPEPQRAMFLLKAKRKPLEIPQLTGTQPDSRIIDIIAKATNFKPEDRYSSLEEMYGAVDSVLSTMETEEKLPKDINVRRGNGFKDVAGMDELKERVQREVIDIFRDPEGAKEYGVSIPNGILLYGPPGCGKTYFAEKMAEEIGCNFKYVKCSDVASPYIHGGQEKIAAIFDDARSKAPTLLFLDEVDALLMKRSKHNNASESGEVNEFLCQLNNCGESNVLVVAATNRVDDIDEAAVRSGRLETKYYIGPPTEEAIAEMFRLSLSKTKSAITDCIPFARKMKGCSAADVKLVVDTAARAAFFAKKPIDPTMLEEAIRSALIKTTTPERPKIGF